jgi:hypothetical protein
MTSSFVYGNLSPLSSTTYFDDARKKQLFPSTFLKDVISGTLSKIFHRVLGIVQTKSIRNSEKRIFENTEELTDLTTEEFSKAYNIILENSKE